MVIIRVAMCARMRLLSSEEKRGEREREWDLFVVTDIGRRSSGCCCSHSEKSIRR
jgi:hypothetical protein